MTTDDDGSPSQPISSADCLITAELKNDRCGPKCFHMGISAMCGGNSLSTSNHLDFQGHQHTKTFLLEPGFRHLLHRDVWNRFF